MQGTPGTPRDAHRQRGVSHLRRLLGLEWPLSVLTFFYMIQCGYDHSNLN